MLRVLIICFVIVNAQIQLQAQPGDPGDDPDKVPLDPGTWVLVAAGVGYGIKKWKDSKQHITDDSKNKSEV